MAIVAAGLAAVNRFVLTVQYMESASMAPAIAVGDRYLVDRLGFRITGLRYGDVAVFVSPTSHAELVKRVVGLPHDTMSCVDSHSARNGHRVDEEYLPGGMVMDCAPAIVGRVVG